MLLYINIVNDPLRDQINNLIFELFECYELALISIFFLVLIFYIISLEGKGETY